MPVLDPDAIVRTVDSGTLRPRLATGREDTTKTDYIRITANGAAVNATDRNITISAQNDDAASTATNVHLTLGGKGKSLVYLPLYAQVADLPTNAAAYYGSLAVVNVTGVYKLYISTTAGWTVVGAQS